MTQELAHTGLFRSHDACVAGVCAGIAERCDFDPIVVRILAVLLTFASFGLVVLVYLALWINLPLAPEPVAPYDITPEQAISIAHGDLGYTLPEELDATEAANDPGRLPLMARLAIAVGLMLLFLIVATNAAPIVSGTQWWQFWPLSLLIIGLCLIVIPVRTRYEAAWHASGIVITSLAASMLPMALGVLSWDTFLYGFQHLWVLVAVAAALFGTGLYRGIDALVIAGAFCLTAFCLLSLGLFASPGEAGGLLINLPDGRTLRLALLFS